MDRQIVLDVNLGFGNDYESLSVPESNTILSFLNRKIKARQMKKQSEESSEVAVSQVNETATTISSVGTAFCTASAMIDRETKPMKPQPKSKLHETSLLSAVSTSDDEDNIMNPVISKQLAIAASKNEEKKEKKTRNSTGAVAASSVTPTFRFLSYRITSENWVMYTIEITNGVNRWRFESRYSLLKIFQEKLGEELSNEKLPEFPGKQWFGNLSDEFIKDRMITIERFMNAAFRNTLVQKTQIFQEFLRQSRENCIDF